jgi:hypothetical protein
VRPLGFLPTLLACAALVGLAPAANAASPPLPAGADAPPVLPPGVVAADAPVHAATPQAPSSAGRLIPLGSVASASATDPKPAWATVNICDTEKSPNGLGVRASMPGNGRDELMFMRFTSQYWSPSREEWVTVPGGGTSRWVYAGLARYAARQTGWTFFFDQPPAGTTFVMRAVVEQQWRAQTSAAGHRHARKQSTKRSAKKLAAKKRAAKRTARKQAARKHAARKHAARKRAAKRRAAKRRAAHKHAVAGHVHKKHGRKRHGQRKRAHKRHLQPSHASGRRGHLAVVKSRSILTKTGYEGVDGGDPVGTSKAMCLIW